MRLVISDNEGAMAVVPFARDEISVGRKEGNTIRLTERNVSRQHCKIQRVSGGFVIRDLGSYNGVVVNGQRIQGEAPLAPGDEIRVGDYTLVLEGEVSKSAEPAQAPAAQRQSRAGSVSTQAGVGPPQGAAPTPASLVPLAPLGPPPRLVVLSGPLAGGEYSIPPSGELRIGRAPDLDVSIDHRSVSREHAKVVCGDGHVRIVDLGSVNGVVINGQKLAEADLSAGDRVELGDIVLRFVGAGEAFSFESSPEARGMRKQRVFLVGGGVATLCVLGALVLQWSRAPSTGSVRVASSAEPAAIAAPKRPDAAAQARALREACVRANAAERFPEAAANASAALKLEPDSADAQLCARTAATNLAQEQLFLHGKAALERGDFAGALEELEQLSPEGPVARRPEVKALVSQAVDSRLAELRSGLRNDPAASAAALRSLTSSPFTSDEQRAEIEGLVADAETEVGSTDVRPGRPPSRAKAAVSSAEARSGKPMITPFDEANVCLARGDTQCVIKALKGRAQTAQELGLLIETYRAIGNIEQASQHMSTYLQRFPKGKSAAAYRELLQRAAR